MSGTEISVIRHRRSYSKAFKAQVVAECSAPQASIASVALAHGLNANLVHKWIRRAQTRADAPPAFVSVVPAGRAPGIGKGQAIELEIQRGDIHVLVRWPADESIACAVWLSEWLK